MARRAPAKSRGRGRLRRPWSWLCLHPVGIVHCRTRSCPIFACLPAGGQRRLLQARPVAATGPVRLVADPLHIGTGAVIVGRTACLPTTCYKRVKQNRKREAAVT